MAATRQRPSCRTEGIDERHSSERFLGAVKESGPADEVIEQLHATITNCEGRSFGRVTDGDKPGVIEIKAPWLRVYADNNSPDCRANDSEWSVKIYANGDTYRIYNTKRQMWSFWKEDANRGIPLHQDPEYHGARTIQTQLQGQQWVFEPPIEPLEEYCEELLAIKE